MHYSFVVVDFEFVTAELERATIFEKCSAVGDGDDIKLKTIVKIVAREIAVSKLLIPAWTWRRHAAKLTFKQKKELKSFFLRFHF